MISNYVLKSNISTLKAKRTKLVEEKIELSKSVTAIGISSQAAWKQKTGRINKIDNDGMALRATYSNRLLVIDRELTNINSELRELFKEESSERNRQLMNVFKEIFTQTQMNEISKEATNRMNGGEPNMISLYFKRANDYEKKYYEYRELAKEQLEKMIQFRLLLTGLIEKGCEQFGNGEFLKFISPLNQLIIPLKELERIKKENFL